MGGQQSKSEQQNLAADVNWQDQSHFFVEELTKMSFKNRRQVSYYWIDPKVYNAENQKYFNQFLAHFKIDSFTSLEALKSELDQIQNNQLIKVITAASLPDDDYRHMQNQHKIAQIFLFCGNEERAKLLCKNFPKIRGYALKSLQMIEVLKKFQQQDNLDIPPCSILCMLQQDRKLLNRYRLNYFCITSLHHKAASKSEFINLARALLPEQQGNIDRFERQYNITLKGKEMQEQALRWAFEDSFYWQMIERLPKATTDPKRMAYLRLPFSDLYQAIFQRKVQQFPEELYIVANLNIQQIQKLNDNEILSNYVIFTTFAKGFTRKSDAIKQFKQSDRSFLFEVTCMKQKKRQAKLDFGFVISEDKTIKKNVIFNIYNFFQLESFVPAKRTGTLIYGSLAQAYYNRADQSSKKRVTENESMLLRNYDYVEQLIRRDSSQAVILQMSGYFKQSLQIYQKKVQFLRKTNASESNLAKYMILRGDAYRMTEDYEQAEKQYKNIINQEYRPVSLVHLMELYIKKGDDRQAQQIQEQLQQPSFMRKLKEKFPEEGFRAENYIALQWMKQGKFREALKKYKNLQAQATVFYQYRFEGIPLVHDIFRNMATCEAKLNNHKEALNLLNSTKEWQLVCEGQSAGLALTETMIQSVHEEMGNKQYARETSDSIQQLFQGINLQEKRYLDQSSIAISMGLGGPKNIIQSRVNLQPNVNTSSVNVNVNPPMNVNQSSVNVQMNPHYNVNQSSVNVNVNMNQHLNVNQSSVNVNMNPPVNVNQSSVNVNLDPSNPQPINQNWMKSQHPQNINESNINIRL